MHTGGCSYVIIVAVIVTLDHERKQVNKPEHKSKADDTTNSCAQESDIDQFWSFIFHQYTYNRLPPPTIGPIGVFWLELSPVAGTAVADAAAVDDSTMEAVVETVAVPLISAS